MRLELSRYEKQVFILPAALLILGLSIYPLLYSLRLSFTSWHLGAPTGFVGFRNYLNLLMDPRFHSALRNTLVFVVTTCAVEYVIGFALALVVSREFKGKAFLRLVLTLPMMLAPVAIGYMWRMIFHPTLGSANHLLHLLGLGPLDWTADPRLALLSVIIVDVWEWTPFYVLVLLAGLQSLSATPFEAAAVDGASPWQTFRYVTFPLMWPLSTTLLFLRAIEGFKIFDQVFVLTGGGPGIATETTTLFIYTQGFKHFDLGYAAAASYLLLFVVVVVCTFLINAVRRNLEVRQS